MRITKAKLNKSGEPIILNSNDYFFIKEDGIEIEKSWNDLANLLDSLEVQKIKDTYPQNQVKIIFEDMWALSKRIEKEKATGKAPTPTKLKERKQKVYETSYSKLRKLIGNQVNAIVALDKVLAMGDDDFYPYDLKIHNSIISQITKDNIVVVGRNTFESKWFQNTLLLDASEIRVLTKDFTPIGKYKDKTKVCYNINSALSRSENDFREIYVLGGEKTLELCFEFLTDLWVSFLDIYFKDPSKYFSDIEWNSWLVRECLAISKDNEQASFTHLQIAQKRKAKFKQNPNRYNMYLDKNYYKRKRKDENNATEEN